MIKLNLFTPSAQEIKDSRKRKSLKKGNHQVAHYRAPHSTFARLFEPLHTLPSLVHSSEPSHTLPSPCTPFRAIARLFEPLHTLPSHCVPTFSDQAACGLGQYEQHPHPRNHFTGTSRYPLHQPLRRFCCSS